MPTSGEIREKLLDEVRGGLSIRKAAVRVGVSVGSATRWARAANVKGGTSTLRIDRKSRKQIAGAIMGGRSCEEVAEAFGIDPARAVKIAGSAKTSPKPRKSKEEAIEVARQNGLHLREVYVALRAKVAEATAQRLSVAAIASKLGIKETTVAKMVRQVQFEHRRDDLRLQIMAAVDAGLSIRQAAAEVGVSVGSATRWAKADGARSRPVPVRHGPEKRDAALRALAEGLSFKQAAAQVGVTTLCVRQWQRRAQAPKE